MWSLVEVAHAVGRDPAEVETWIVAHWVRPSRADNEWRFAEVDLARARLICEVRYDLGVEPETVPVVLSLMDQMYQLRRQLRDVAAALAQESEEVRARIAGRLNIDHD